MADPFLTFIGGGNMANSIIGGLVAKNYSAQSILACDPLADNLRKLASDYGVHTSSDNVSGVQKAAAVILAVKPQIMRKVCEQLKEGFAHKPLIISIAAGITSSQLNQWLGDDLPIVRCMPNTPALVQCGASGLFANRHTNAEQKALADHILSAVGIVEWLQEESLIDAVTALSGSGPAYFFLLMEAMIAAGVKQGLDAATARRLCQQTCLGAGLLAQNSDVDVAELRRRVTSPGGTTEQAILSFEKNQFSDIVEQAMAACAKRAVTLAEELGNKE